MHIWSAKQWIYSGAVDKIIKLYTFLFSTRIGRMVKGMKIPERSHLFPALFLGGFMSYMTMYDMFDSGTPKKQTFSLPLSLCRCVCMCVWKHTFLYFEGAYWLLLIDQHVFFIHIFLLCIKLGLFFFTQRKNYNHSKPLKALRCCFIQK